jgi:hypothetical protein
MKGLFLLGVAAVLSSCAAVVGEGAHVAKNRTIYNNNISKAQRGDVVAQFNVGEALCCSIDEKDHTFYSTRKAVGWLCASAVQGHVPAMYKIGKIYSGDVVDGVRLARRLAQGVAGTSENHPVAYNWLVQAAARGEKDAKPLADKLWDGMEPAQQAETRKLVDEGLRAACRWEDAILSKR